MHNAKYSAHRLGGLSLGSRSRRLSPLPLQLPNPSNLQILQFVLHLGWARTEHWDSPRKPSRAGAEIAWRHCLEKFLVKWKVKFCRKCACVSICRCETFSCAWFGYYGACGCFSLSGRYKLRIALRSLVRFAVRSSSLSTTHFIGGFAFVQFPWLDNVVCLWNLSLPRVINFKFLLQHNQKSLQHAVWRTSLFIVYL